jgi:acyl-CoA hydrolase
MEPKKQSESLSVLAHLVLPYQANPAGNVHGGEIMKIMDSTAGVAAQKHSRKNVVTARVEELCFRKPVLVGELVTCKAQVIYAGHSSMEVFVSVESEDLPTGRQQIALTAFFTMVALDENGHPCEVAPIEFSNDNIYEQKLYLEGQKRYLARKEGHSKKEGANGGKI